MCYEQVPRISKLSYKKKLSSKLKWLFYYCNSNKDFCVKITSTCSTRKY